MPSSQRGYSLFQARKSLGGALLLSGNSAEAEKVFREDLKMNLRSGHPLFGLMESLKAQGKRAGLSSFKESLKGPGKTQIRN